MTIDGISGDPAHHHLAAGELLRAMNHALTFGTPAALEEAHQRAHEAMSTLPQLRKTGACYVAWVYLAEESALAVRQGGDAALIVADSEGHARDKTSDQVRYEMPAPFERRSVPTNPVVGDQTTQPTPYLFKIQVGDTILSTSDGLLKLIPREQAAAIVAHHTLEEARDIFLRLIETSARHDDVTFTIIKVTQLPLASVPDQS